MTFKSKLLGRRAVKEDCSTSTCSDDSAEEHNAFEIFINDASSVVANVFQEAASTGDDDASECSTDTDSSEEAEAEAYTDTRAGEPKAKVTFKTKLLGRRRLVRRFPRRFVLGGSSGRLFGWRGTSGGWNFDGVWRRRFRDHYVVAGR